MAGVLSTRVCSRGVSRTLLRICCSSLSRRMLSDETNFHRTLSKLDIVDSSRGRIMFELTVDKEHLNRAGNMHGGLTATLVDETTTMAILMAEKPAGVTVDMNITYMGAAKEGDILSITAVCVKAGRNMAFATADIVNKASGKVIAQGKQTKYIAI